MITFDKFTEKNTENITDTRCRFLTIHTAYWILIEGSSGSGKTNVLLNVIDHQPDIDKLFSLYATEPYESIYQFVINKRQDVALKHFNDPKAFIGNLNDIKNVHETIEDYNPGVKKKLWSCLITGLLIWSVIKSFCSHWDIY